MFEEEKETLLYIVDMLGTLFPMTTERAAEAAVIMAIVSNLGGDTDLIETAIAEHIGFEKYNEEKNRILEAIRERMGVPIAIGDGSKWLNSK